MKMINALNQMSGIMKLTSWIVIQQIQQRPRNAFSSFLQSRAHRDARIAFANRASQTNPTDRCGGRRFTIQWPHFRTTFWEKTVTGDFGPWWNIVVCGILKNTLLKSSNHWLRTTTLPLCSEKLCLSASWRQWDIGIRTLKDNHTWDTNGYNNMYRYRVFLRYKCDCCR